MTALGLVSLKGRPLTEQTFGSLLTNPIYAGSLSVEAFGIHGIRGDFEPLVSEDVFHRVQRALKNPNGPISHRLNNPEFPLRRFVVCDACDTPTDRQRIEREGEALLLLSLSAVQGRQRAGRSHSKGSFLSCSKH